MAGRCALKLGHQKEQCAYLQLLQTCGGQGHQDVRKNHGLNCEWMISRAAQLLGLSAADKGVTEIVGMHSSPRRLAGGRLAGFAAIRKNVSAGAANPIGGTIWGLSRLRSQRNSGRTIRGIKGTELQEVRRPDRRRSARIPISRGVPALTSARRAANTSGRERLDRHQTHLVETTGDLDQDVTTTMAEHALRP